MREYRKRKRSVLELDNKSKINSGRYLKTVRNNDLSVKEKQKEKELVIAQGKKKTRKDKKRLIDSFHSSIQRDPEYICTCCDQLWYKSCVKKMCPQGI